MKVSGTAAAPLPRRPAIRSDCKYNKNLAKLSLNGQIRKKMILEYDFFAFPSDDSNIRTAFLWMRYFNALQRVVGHRFIL